MLPCCCTPQLPTVQQMIAQLTTIRDSLGALVHTSADVYADTEEDPQASAERGGCMAPWDTFAMQFTLRLGTLPSFAGHTQNGWKLLAALLPFELSGRTMVSPGSKKACCKTGPAIACGLGVSELGKGEGKIMLEFANSSGLCLFVILHEPTAQLIVHTRT